MDSEKIATITKWDRLTNTTEVCSFLDFAGYHQNIVKRFASMPKTINQLTGNGVKFEWSEKCEEGFQKLNEHLTQTRVFVLPRSRVPYMVYTVASGSDFGCVLVQKDQVMAYPV